MNVTEITEILLKPVDCPPNLPSLWIVIVLGFVLLRLIYSCFDWIRIPTVGRSYYRR